MQYSAQHKESDKPFFFCYFKTFQYPSKVFPDKHMSLQVEGLMILQHFPFLGLFPPSTTIFDTISSNHFLLIFFSVQFKGSQEAQMFLSIGALFFLNKCTRNGLKQNQDSTCPRILRLMQSARLLVKGSTCKCKFFTGRNIHGAWKYGISNVQIHSCKTQDSNLPKKSIKSNIPKAKSASTEYLLKITMSYKILQGSLICNSKSPNRQKRG